MLSRIKQDEQRWLNVALLLFGALLAFFTGSFGSALKFDTPCRSIFGLLISLATIHAAAWAWTMQALNLRVQYYRSMVRLFEVELDLGMSLPDPWHRAKFQDWREGATLPGESKKVEMLLLGGLVCATGVLATYCFTAGPPFRHLDWYYVLPVLGCVASSGLAWPLVIYPWWDRRLLQRKLFQKNGPVQKLRERDRRANEQREGGRSN